MTEQQDVNQEPTAPEASGATEPEYITKKQFDEFSESFKKYMDGMYRGVQSQTDRYQQAVQSGIKSLEQNLELLKSQGVEVSPEQVKAMKNQVKLDALGREPEPSELEKKPVSEDAAIDPVTKAGITLMRNVGVEVEDDDPEAEIIMKAVNGTEEEYFKACAEAAKAKAARLADQGKSPATRQLTSLKGSPSSNSLQNIKNPSDLWELAVKEGNIK